MSLQATKQVLISALLLVYLDVLFILLCNFFITGLLANAFVPELICV